jgi:hypothetical protein
VTTTTTVVLTCVNKHQKRLPEIEQHLEMVRAIVKARVVLCDRCRRPIVRVEEEKAS